MTWLKFSYDVKIDFHFRMLLFSHLSLTTRFFVTGEKKFLQLKKERKVGVLFQTKKRLTNLASKSVRIQFKPKRSNCLAIQYIFGLEWKGNI